MLSNDQAIEFLGKEWSKLPKTRQSFALDLVSRSKKYTLSEKQLFWLRKMVDEIECAGVPDFTRPAPVALGNFQGVIELFKTAKQHLKSPAIELALGTEEEIKAGKGRPIVLKIAGPNSKYAGKVMVTDGRPFGQNIWYGSIATDGTWEPSHKATDDVRDEVAALLRRLAQNPAKVATNFGKWTGRCCFCQSGIHGEDGVSAALGYGPVCAKHFGLPWGKAVVAQYECK